LSKPVKVSLTKKEARIIYSLLRYVAKCDQAYDALEKFYDGSYYELSFIKTSDENEILVDTSLKLKELF